MNKPLTNLQEVLSYSELRQPCRLYTTPGLAAGTILHVAWIGLLTRFLRQWLVPNLNGLPMPAPIKPGDTTWSGPSSDDEAVSIVGLVFYSVWTAASVLFLAPLECALVRLSTQRPEKQNPLHMAYANNADAPNAPASYSHQASVPAQVNADANDTPSRASFAIEDPEEEEDEAQRPNEANTAANKPLHGSSAASRPTHLLNEPSEPVIALRPCDEADSAEEAARMEAGGFGAPVVERYVGLVDCLKKMREEEGLESLGRGWWVSLLGIAAGSFA